MVLLNEGLNEIATRLASDITKGQYGSGTTDVTVSDTGLETPIASTLLTLSNVSVSGNSVQFEHFVSSAVGNSNTFSEFELQFDNGTSLNRSVGASFSKTNSFEVTTFVNLSINRSS